MTKKKTLTDITRFKANTNYWVGVVPENNENADFAREPKFSEKPNKSIAQVGSFFMSPPINCKTFWEYLAQNPHKFPLHKQVACYAFDNNRQIWDFVGKGNPTVTGEQTNLSDGTSLTEQNRVPQNQDNYRQDKFIAQTLQDNMVNYQRQNEALLAQIADLQNKWFAKMEENNKLQAENERLKIQNEEQKGLMDKYMDKDDEPKPSLMDSLGSVIANPQIAPLLAEGLGMVINGLKNKFGGKTQEQSPEMQSPAEQKFNGFQNGTVPADSLNGL